MDDRNDTPKGADPHEQRTGRRFDSRLPLYVNGERARLTDVSTTGVGFIAAQPIEPGTHVDIGIRHLPDDDHPATCRAEVVRVSSSEGGFEIGARLEQPVSTKPERQ